jgi:hypothetical protein
MLDATFFTALCDYFFICISFIIIPAGLGDLLIVLTSVFTTVCTSIYCPAYLSALLLFIGL